MAARIDNFFDESTKNAILNCKLLVVGAGGIGCELLKNLVQTGFEDIHVMDLDTIDVSNLNRQFLFQKTHVGKAKAVIAKESAEKLNPKSKITAYHDSIMNLKYDVEFYRQFSAVANALDNMGARKHVNRMCLAADIPLIESGSAGYLGQVTVYKKKQTECYECISRPAPKDFPTCTIRNTPSESIHCVVWAKHLFNQLFGEEDPHQDVSPDSTEPAIATGGPRPQPSSGTEDLTKLSTREWAKKCNYDAKALFKKLFHDDVKYLLEMKHLWETRKPPITLDWEDLPDAVVAGCSMHSAPTVRELAVWSLRECANTLEASIAALRKAAGEGGENILTWDKDDKHSMDFVAACSNLRSHCFGITTRTRFQIKSMAGNIIPAIATTNAIIGGLIVLQLMKVLKGQLDKCRTIILNKTITPSRNKLLAPIEFAKPNPECFVCSTNTPEVHVRVNIATMIIKSLEEKVLKECLNMIAPDVFFDDGKGTILVSSDPDEDMEGMKEKTLQVMGLQSGSRLQCDDFFQQFTLSLHIHNNKHLADQDFEVISDLSMLKPLPDEPAPEEVPLRPPVSEKEPCSADVLDDIMFVDHEVPSSKRKHDDENGEHATKRHKSDEGSSASDEMDIVAI